MNRATVGLDRVATFVVGAVLAVGGAAMVWWAVDDTLSDRRVEAAWATTATDQAWWPWTVGAAGVILALIGLRWLVAHLPGRKVGEVPIPGSDRTGRLRADLSAVAAAAGDALAHEPDVKHARGKAIDDRGRRTVQIVATIDPTADLDSVAGAAERTCREVAQVLDPQTAARVHLRVARRSRSRARVE